MLKSHEVEYIIEPRKQEQFSFQTRKWRFETALARPTDEPPYGSNFDVLVVSWRGEEEEFLVDPEKQNYAVSIWSYRL
jgi:hypothetical protein